MEQSEDFHDGLREVMRGFLEEIPGVEMDEAPGRRTAVHLPDGEERSPVVMP